MDAEQRERLRQGLDALDEAVKSRTALLHYAVPVTAEQVERDEAAYRQRLLAEAVRGTGNREDGRAE